MHQLELFGGISGQVVNVSSVPQRSLFRYPGGKTWLVPYIRRWLCSLSNKPTLLIEPFTGGGIVGLTSAFEGLVERVLLVELDEQVASVWKTILSGEGEWLAERIITFRMTQESLTEELNKKGGSVRETAFRTLLWNRTSHGGIMAPGAGIIKYGENGKGITSRWYPSTLAKRIRNIDKIRDRIDFVQGDGLAIICEHIHERETVYFIDPPYTAAGKRAGTRLYTHHELDHEELFTLVESLNGEFIMTYDCADGVRAMALRHRFDVVEVPMSNTHHVKMNELIISKNLGWIK